MRQARFQSFTPATRPELAGARLAALRHALHAQELQGLLLPRADIFQGEYLPASEDRLAWLTGFSGSAGFVIVLPEACALFVDGRYTVQAREEVDASAITVVPIAETSPEDWLAENARGRIGYDASLFTARGLKRFSAAAEKAGLALVAVEDPVATVWSDRPPAPATIAVDHPLSYAGESREAKLARLQAELTKDKLAALVVSENPAVCWLFNLRAADVEHLPVLRAFALVPATGQPTLFVDPARLEPALAKALDGFAEIVPPRAAPGDGRAELVAALAPLAKGGGKIRLDADTAPALLSQAIEAAGGVADAGTDPIAKAKAAKNAAELAGARAAHTRDGVAMVKFLRWLEENAGKADEIDATIALESFRLETGALHDLSFGTIAGAGPNAALPHYRVTQKTNRKITPGLFLVDSGGQYRDGTTDITRTVQIGRAGKAMREAYTRVLKGMIAVSLAVFPKGASGAQLDTLARQFLWAAGQDFDHGTGHGVGSFLSVHEGPQRISKFGAVTLDAGMILSNEPGFYREGAFGIRIENLVVVEERHHKHFEREMLGFETLTLCPIDTRPVVKSWLTRSEKMWLNAYHAAVEAALAPHLSGDDLAFLKAACRAI